DRTHRLRGYLQRLDNRQQCPRDRRSRAPNTRASSTPESCECNLGLGFGENLAALHLGQCLLDCSAFFRCRCAVAALLLGSFLETYFNQSLLRCSRPALRSFYKLFQLLRRAGHRNRARQPSHKSLAAQKYISRSASARPKRPDRLSISWRAVTASSDLRATILPCAARSNSRTWWWSPAPGRLASAWSRRRA